MNQSIQESTASSRKLVPWIVKSQCRDAAGVIRAGLDSLFTLRINGVWGAHSGTEAVAATACVLARLAELPVQLFSHSRIQDIQYSLDWLASQQKNGRWNASSQPDCAATAWAVIALRAHRRSIPAEALDYLSLCRSADGSFTNCPGHESESDLLKSLALTATVCKALGWLDQQAEEFLAGRIQCALPGTGSQPPSSGIFACSQILDWPEGLASMAVLNKVSQLTCHVEADNAYGQALLLRSLLRLRIARSWPVAARLRELQGHDGNWYQHASFHGVEGDLAGVPGPTPVHQAVITATAVSALSMAESQPGLYFGSDLPLPQRF